MPPDAIAEVIVKVPVLRVVWTAFVMVLLLAAIELEAKREFVVIPVEILAVPFTSKVKLGDVVAIPTLPLVVV